MFENSNNLPSSQLQIVPNAFLNLINLEELHLGSNRISYLPLGMFANLSSLKKLFLFFNDLTYIPQFAFIGLRSLRTLLLNNNQILDFDDAIFEPLQQIEKM